MTGIFIIFCLVVVVGITSHYLWKHSDSINTLCDGYENLLNDLQRDIDASPRCCKSLVHLLGKEAQCHCSRCRTRRGESVTAETQSQAEMIQERACRAFSAIIDSSRNAAEAK